MNHTFCTHKGYNTVVPCDDSCPSLQKESEWDENLKKSFLKELDFLSDHWVNGDDKPPFSFGGWREEVANEFVKITKNVVSNREKEIAEEVEKLKRETLHEKHNEESQAPHETPTKTCTCPHCDNWRCDHKRV